jgi:hypothetical protein
MYTENPQQYSYIYFPSLMSVNSKGVEKTTQ